MSLTFRRIGGVLGAELSGFDTKTEHPTSTYDEIKQALAEHCVLVIRDQHLSDLESVEFLDRLGKTFDQWNITPEHLSPDTAKVYILSSYGSRYAGSVWHADYAFMDRPADVSCMHMRTLPSAGGDTGFANMYAAYDALSDGMKCYLENLTAVFDNSRRYRLQYATMKKPSTSKQQLDRVPIARHPLVLTHPLTGRKALYVSEALVDTIVDLPARESAAIVGFLHEHVAQPQFHYRHSWRDGDLVLVDNRCTNHCAIADYDVTELRQGIVLCAHMDPSPFKSDIAELAPLQSSA